MKALSGKAFCRLLERHGWQLLRVQGSHHVHGKAGERARISVPVHGNRPLKLGLQRHLLKLAGIDEDEAR
ncbi:MAG: type II toxin-antitoxin system HicA family toxin [Geminicoccaceae bacterium]